MTRLCLDCRRVVPETHVERNAAGGWWCRWPAICAIERAEDGPCVETRVTTIDEAEAAEARRRGLRVETAGTTTAGGTVWEVRRP